MKRLLFAVLCVRLAVTASAANIGLLLGETGHNKEFDPIFATHPHWNIFRFPCSKDGMQQLSRSLDKLDLVIAVPLFNWRGHKPILGQDDTDYGAIRRYLEKGGGLVIVDGTYATVRAWLNNIADVGDVKTGDCKSSVWQVLGHVSNTEPVHTLRAFPNLVTEGNYWGHFEEVPASSKWKVLARCSEGNPVGLYQEIGKGWIYWTALRQTHDAPLENYVAWSVLKQHGMSVESFSMNPLAPGKDTLTLHLRNDAPKGASLSLEFMDEKGRETTFITNFTGKSCTLEYAYDKRGPVTQKFSLNIDGADTELFSRKTVLPKIMEIDPNAYRGILSTKRREKDVDFLLRFAPAHRDLTRAAVTLTVYDACSNAVCSTSVTLPTNEVPARLWVPVELPKELSAGGYEMRAVLKKGNLTLKDEAPFEILAPIAAQTVIDEDNTFLVSGKPFFPLGTYHTHMQLDEVADIGFNASQFWAWDLWMQDGIPYGLHHMVTHKMKALYEGGGREQVPLIRDNPAIMMWYVGDEPTESSEASIADNNAFFHRADKQHPTFICSNRPDLYHIHQRHCDVLGTNPPYAPDGGKYSSLTNIIYWIKLAQEKTEGRKPIVLIPGTLGQKNIDFAKETAYAAIVHDIRGFFWYCWKQVGGGADGIGLNTNKEWQAIIKDLIAELKKITPSLCTPGRRTFEEGDLHGIVCPNAPQKQRLIVLFNLSEKELETDLFVPEMEAAREVFDAFTGEKSPSVEKGRIKIKLPPLERAAFKW